MWSLTFRFPDQNSVCISILSHTYSMPRPFHPALLTLTLSGENYKHEAPHFAFISSLLSFIPSEAQISSTSLYCRTPSSLCRPSIWQPKFHIHTKHAMCILITVFLDSKREGKGSEYHVTAHKPTCHNLQARRVELNKAASSEGRCFCWQKINQNNIQCSLRLSQSDRVSMYFPNNLQNICSNTKRCTHVPPSR